MKKKRKKTNDELDEVSPQLELNFDDPDIEIDFHIVEQLCFIQADIFEIRAKLGCSEQTLDKRCMAKFGKTISEYHADKKAIGRLAIKQKQFEFLMGRPKKRNDDDITKSDWRAVQFLSAVILGQSAFIKKDTESALDKKPENKLSKMSYEDLEKMDELFSKYK